MITALVPATLYLHGRLAKRPSAAKRRPAIERARIQLAAGRSNVTDTIAHAAAAAVLRTLGYRPLLAEPPLVEGHAAMRTDPVGAAATLRAATETAFAAHLDAIAIEAWARREWLEGRERPETAFGGSSASTRWRSARARSRALPLNNFATIVGPISTLGAPRGS